MADSDILARIMATKAEEVIASQVERPLEALEQQARSATPPRGFAAAIRARIEKGHPAVIAEIKRASPSKGHLATIADPAALARAYADGGASAISVLTERRRFGGSLDDLATVREAVATPLLRKDFVVTEYQLWEGRAAGADLALLIVAALDDAELGRFLRVGGELGLTCLVETHTADEVRRAVDAGAELIGVNNRNLKTLDVDLARFEELVGLIPAGVVTVAESGILSLADAERMAAADADAVLVGEALVRDGDPRTAVAALRAVNPLL